MEKSKLIMFLQVTSQQKELLISFSKDQTIQSMGKS